MPFRCEGESVTSVVHEIILDSSLHRLVDPACAVAQGRQQPCGFILHRAPCSVLLPQWRLYGGGRVGTRCRQGGTMPRLAVEPVKMLEAASSGGGGGLSKAGEAQGYGKTEVRMSQPKVLLDVPLEVPPEVPPRVPEEVKKRLKGWCFTFWGCTLCHYLCGIGGVLAAAVAASASNNPSIVKGAGILGAVCVSILGFVQPERQSRKYVTA
jgi:hypothetical protein